jgi:MoaA/NifB/PqqE/SkfB family radical SAM enzyme
MNSQKARSPFKADIDLDEVTALMHREDPRYRYSLTVLENTERFISLLQGEKPCPIELEIFPSGVCNATCTYCLGRNCGSHPSAESGSKIEIPLMMEICRSTVHMNDALRQAGKSGILGVKFSGSIGEPLLADSTVTAIEFFSDKGVNIGLFTNGSRLTEDVINRIMGLSYIHISADGATPKTLLAVKGLDFNVVTRNIANLVDARNQSGHTLDINVSFVIQEENIHDIVAAARLFKEIGANGIRYRFDVMAKLIPEDLVISDYIEAAKGFADDGFAVSFIDTREKRKSSCFRRCLAAYMYPVIGADGALRPCNHASRSCALILDLHTISLEEAIFSNARYEALRSFPNGCCTYCSNLNYTVNALGNYIGNTIGPSFAFEDNDGNLLSENVG